MRKRLVVGCAVVVCALSIAPIRPRAQGQTVGSTTPDPQRGQQPAAPAGRGQGRGRGPAAPALPTPHWTDGRVNLGAVPGQLGVWLPGGGTFSDPDVPNGRAIAGGPAAEGAPPKPKLSEVPFQPWAKALFEYRQTTQFEPHTRCKPSGGARQFLTPYGVEFVDLPDLQRMYIFDIGGPHTFRTIYMDQKEHPRDLVPSYYGHSIGHWEGETLVVDSTGFNERFWMDRQGTPHTEKLRFIERFTRLNMNVIKYEITIDDPGAYTRPWNTGFTLRWSPGQELFEYVCQDNNHAPDLMIGVEKSVDRTSRIVP